MRGKVVLTPPFDTTADRSAQMKIGVSFHQSGESARQSVAGDSGLGFRRRAATGRSGMGERAREIRIDGGTDEQRRIFYTALFHSHYMPHDLTGENCLVEIQ